MSTNIPFKLTPGLPTYTQARAFLKEIRGVEYSTYRSMYDRIVEQIGSPQDTRNWTDPDEWIPLRLSNSESDLAFKIWRGTEHIVNPRHTRGCWYFSTKHSLLTRGPEDLLELTPAGIEFCDQPKEDLISEIDQSEGLLNVLQAVSEHTPGKRSEILPSYVDFCNSYTTYRSLDVHKSSLYDRLVNLIERGLILRRGIFYEITEFGLKYLKSQSHLILGRAIVSQQTRLLEIAKEISQEARKKLSDYLSQMDPYRFEELVSLLLEEMGYNNVIVTAPSNDKGVDVVADIELGISSVREVVQVKRHVGSINRTILDQLRGSLHRFKAMRGTIISTGSFSSGAKSAALEQGAAPITLIDGNKLLDLFMQYEIGISKKAIEFFEFDSTKLQVGDDDAGQS